ncbi:neuromedin-U isoform X2 [Alosa alosa]|uniref:neuromedin-U isoform X2 n=1 Tax=Alosa alosa TaxID=278164 RepID=UPI0020152021|nr:neuromedin-U isoform X2 [Alosa alosa]
MPTHQCPSGTSHSSSSNSSSHTPTSSGGVFSTMSPPNSAILTLAVAFLLSTIPLCKSAPVLQQRPTIDYDQLVNQVDDICTSFFSEDFPFRAREMLGEVCVLMLGALQKAQDLTPRDNSKRFLFHYAKSGGDEIQNEMLVSAMPSKKQVRRATALDDVKGPGGIQSRGYFLYRPRNGRRSAEYV